VTNETRKQELIARLRALMGTVAPSGKVIAGLEFIGGPENGYQREVIAKENIVKEIRKARTELETLNG
jgi:hypothetical protein